MISDNNISPAEQNIEPKLSGEIYDGINYICKLNNCDSIKELFSEQYDKFLIEHKLAFEENKKKDLEFYKENTVMLESIKDREYKEPSRWEIVQAITDTIWVQAYYRPNQPENIYHNFYLNAEQSQHFPISVVWYEKLIRIDQGNYGLTLETYININSVNENLSVTINGDTEEVIDISSVFSALRSIGSQWKENLSSQEMTFEIQWESLEWKLFLENISFPKNKSDNEIDRGYASGYLLIR